MALKFSLPPKAFSLMLKNVLEFTAGNVQRYPHILIHAERDGRDGTVSAIGIGGALSARDWAEIHGAEGEEVAEVSVLAVNADKSDIIDDLAKLAAAIGKTSTAKSASVFVSIEHGRKITVEYGGQLVGELPHQGVRSPFYDTVENALDLDDWGPAPGPTALLLDTIKAVTKVKGGPAVDIAQLPGYKGMVAVAVGPTFRGLMATVDRPLFAQGGPWRDGPGNPESLLQGTLL